MDLCIPQEYGKKSSLLSPSNDSRGTSLERRKLKEIEDLNDQSVLENATGELAKERLERLRELEQNIDPNDINAINPLILQASGLDAHLKSPNNGQKSLYLIKARKRKNRWK